MFRLLLSKREKADSASIFLTVTRLGHSIITRSFFKITILHQNKISIYPPSNTPRT